MVLRLSFSLFWVVLAVGCADPPAAGDGCPERRATTALKTDHGAADGLWMIEYGRPSASLSVSKLLSHPSPRVRRRAALAAGRMAVPTLSRRVRTLLGDDDAGVRAMAAWSLGLADDTLAEEPLLLRVALDDVVAVRVAALRSLGLVGGAGAARSLLKLLTTEAAGPVRTQVWHSLALLARRGSTLTHAAAPLALTRLEQAAVPAKERRAAALLLATLVQRYSGVRKGQTPKRRKRLKARFAAEKDPETRMQLGRVVIRLKLLSASALAGLARQGGTLGRLSVGSLLVRDGAKGVVLGPLVDKLVKTLPKTACKTVVPVILWQLLGGLASGPRRRWVGPRALPWLESVRGALKKAAAKSCAAHQLARLACRAAVLADLAKGRVKHLDKCSGGALSAGQEQAFLAWGLARGVARRPFRRLRRLWVDGKVRARAAVLTAAGRLGNNPGHALVSRGLVSKDVTLFGAAATACGRLIKADPAAEAVKHSCLVEARRQLLALRLPPAFDRLNRWLELVRLVRGIADNAVMGRLKAAARHHHPTLRQLARTSLAAVLGRPPGATTWRADHRAPPVAPLANPVVLTLNTDAGPITIKLRPDWAPMSAAYILRLVQKGAFASSSFHRVVAGFVVQGGDPTGTGFGGDTSFLLSELSQTRFRRGVVGLAHAGRDTESSQLFITLGPAPHLDGRYTAFAEVTAGIGIADRLLPGARFGIAAPKGVAKVADAPPTPAAAPSAPTRPRPRSPMKPPQPVMKLSPDSTMGTPLRRSMRRPLRRPAVVPMQRPTMGFIKLSMGRTPSRPTMGYLKLSMDRP